MIKQLQKVCEQVCTSEIIRFIIIKMAKTLGFKHFLVGFTSH